MYRRGYCPSIMRCHKNAALAYSEQNWSCVDPSAVDQDGRNAVHMSVLLAVSDAVVDNIAAAEAALDKVIHNSTMGNFLDPVSQHSTPLFQHRVSWPTQPGHPPWVDTVNTGYSLGHHWVRKGEICVAVFWPCCQDCCILITKLS